MSRNLDSPNKLTEFAPLSPEDNGPTVSGLFSRLFGHSKTPKKNVKPVLLANTPEDSTSSDSTSQDISWNEQSDAQASRNSPIAHEKTTMDSGDSRRLSSVLKRVSNLVALRTSGLQAYDSTELRRYWMPDSVSRECYECTAQFSAFKRRHHCRVCGQIFCSACCGQRVPGKIIRCTGDLRVCTYCCKVVLSYLQSPDVGADLTSDLRALQEDLEVRFRGTDSTTSSNEVLCGSGGKRKHSIGHQEDRFSLTSTGGNAGLSDVDRRRALQSSGSIRALYTELIRPGSGINITQHRFRLRFYIGVVLGSDIVTWLITHGKAATKVQALAICQALLEADYLESAVDNNLGDFAENLVYRPKPLSTIESTPTPEPRSGKLSSSSSLFCLDLDLQARSVHLSRPPHTAEYASDLESPDDKPVESFNNELPLVQKAMSEKKSLGFADDKAQSMLWASYREHEQRFLNQMLRSVGLSQDWGDIVIPLCDNIIEYMRPEFCEDFEDMDIRQYVQLKKVPGGQAKDCTILKGVVCSKNVAHKAMAVKIRNPRILLLQCAIVYQRVEGRMMSLEPVMMQEPEYLRHVSDRILALKPDIVLVHRNISRLAQEILRKKGVTLVINVKLSVMERIARCTQADIVTSVDAHIGRPKLGTCKSFYIEAFRSSEKESKTLMFFEECEAPHLGCTVLLRGGNNSLLKKVKHVTSKMLFVRYNWRLEMSYLLNEQAVPPIPKKSWFESKETSPENDNSLEAVVDTAQSNELKQTEFDVKRFTNNLDDFLQPLHVQTNSTCSESRLLVESVSDFSDPLRSAGLDDDVFENLRNDCGMAEQRPFDNRFRLALSQTVLSISPHLTFPLPYLESEAGRKCHLRQFFPTELFYSKQFEEDTNIKELVSPKNTKCSVNIPLRPKHPFLTYKFTTSADSTEFQTLLADFRACGGRLPLRYEAEPTPCVDLESEDDYDADEKDALHPDNHQKLLVLFCSYTKHSSNANISHVSSFCVDPWIVNMQFYGRNDISLGSFLQRYCFVQSFACPSENCEILLLNHIRRFVHGNSCIELSLEQLEGRNNINNEVQMNSQEILMWSWCVHCKQPTRVVPMEPDTWCLSFGKYLELRFHGAGYKHHQGCAHSLHQEHHQYFTDGKVVACFKYSNISLWEASLPPPVIKISARPDIRVEAIDEVKTLALRGYEVFTGILERLSLIGNELESHGPLKTTAIREQSAFKSNIERVQILLAEKAFWTQIADGMFMVKRSICEACEGWNNIIQGTDNGTSNQKARSKDVAPNLEEELDGDISDCHNDSSQAPSDCESTHSHHTPLQAKKIRSMDQSDLDDIDNNDVKSHQRSRSDGITTQNDEKKDNDKKTKKNILSQLLPTTMGITVVQCPFPPTEHYLLPFGLVPIGVIETEPSSVISYTLMSKDYTKALDESTPRTDVKNCSRKSQDSSVEPDDFSYSTLKENEKTSKSQKSAPSPHVEVSFQDVTTNFMCRVYFAHDFESLRDLVLPPGNTREEFARSLSRSIHWAARGGKSGSTFSKTTDDRFILKEMKKLEMQIFCDFAPHYFQYMQKCVVNGTPTLLGKIVGVFRVIFRNGATGSQYTSNLLVMENLFYGRTISHRFDLKGSVRNRLVNPESQTGEELVLLDENLLKICCEEPMYIHWHSHRVLSEAITRDTSMLVEQNIIDYSLLVGLDSDKQELVVGIIDYICSFTWHKRIETMVKKSGILGGQGKLPTVISPDEYRARFSLAMSKYFLSVPNRWDGLIRQIEVEEE